MGSALSNDGRKKESNVDHNLGAEYYGHYVLNCVLMITVVFLALGFLIKLMILTEEGNDFVPNASGKPAGSVTQIDGCSASSFLINDGVCDEIANTERCLYDGGDCCLANKQTHLCHVCTCVFRIDPTLANRKRKETGVQIYNLLEHDIVKHLVVVEDVKGELNCMWLCLQMDGSNSEELSEANSYYFNANGGIGTCICTHLVSCYRSCSLTSLHDNKIQRKRGEMSDSRVFHVQVTKILSCRSGSCFVPNIAFDDAAYDMTQALKTPSSLHCQKLCHNSPGCTHFTWVGPYYYTPYFDNHLKETCWLTGENVNHVDFGTVDSPGMITGPSICPEDDVVIETNRNITQQPVNCPISVDQLGDGFCDDDANTEDCLYDGSDCCLSNPDCSYCLNCTCHKAEISSGCNLPLQFNNEQMCVETDLILMLGGHPLDDSKLESEVIHSLHPEFSECENFEEFPLNITFGVGGFLKAGNKPLVCGGRRMAKDDEGFVEAVAENNCYTTGREEKVLTMVSRRFQAASLVIDSGSTLWVTGGQDAERNSLDSTELITLQPKNVEQGPKLQELVHYHCLLRMDLERALIIGGGSSVNGGELTYRKKVWQYNFDTNTWNELTSMANGRVGHTCGVVKDRKTDEQILLVAGGSINQVDFVNTIEAYNLDAKFWYQLSKNLPNPLSGASGVTTDNGRSFFVIGGCTKEDGTDIYLKTILRFGCIAGDCQWTKIDRELQEARGNSVAITIPESLGICRRI